MNNKDFTAKIFNIQKCSFVDGPGIRTAVFFKGCNLDCAWCHNPEGKSGKTELLYYKNRCTGCGLCREVCENALSDCSLCGECARLCPREARELSGRDYTPDGLYREIAEDKRFYDASGGGVTFSGGECMLQIDFLAEILKKCKAGGIHTAIDTAGYVPFGYFERTLPYTDLYLYDIKAYGTDQHKRYTGVGNELIWENLERLLKSGCRVWIRIPVIADVNDSPDDMRLIKARLSKIGMPEKTELLPYHKMGEAKYGALGTAAQKFEAPTEEKLAELRRIFEPLPCEPKMP